MGMITSREAGGQTQKQLPMNFWTINRKQELKRRMINDGWPRSRKNQFKADFTKSLFAVLFPKSSAVWMPIKGQSKADDWVLEFADPFLRPTLTW